MVVLTASTGTQAAPLVIEKDIRKKYLIMSMLLLVVLILLLVGALPNWGYHKYGFAPSGFAGTVLLIVVILLLTGRL
jgi:hypothetical protein